MKIFKKLALSSIFYFKVYIFCNAQNVAVPNENVNFSSPFTYQGSTYQCDKCTDYKLETTNDIIAIFNFSRRNEEKQLNLAHMSLGNLELPSDFTSYTSGGKAFYLINEERKCRKLKPYDGIEEGLCIVASKYATYCDKNNRMGHQGPNGESADTRITNHFSAWKDIPSGQWCYNLGNTGFGENLAKKPFQCRDLTAYSVINWIYVDAQDQWGHRNICFSTNWKTAYIGWGESGHVGTLVIAEPKLGGTCSSQLNVLGLSQAVNMNSSPQNTNNQTSTSAAPRAELTSDQVLNRGESITSPNGQYKLTLENDGNLVLYQNGQSAWNSNTNNQSVSKCTFQNDGNLVLYTATNQAKWAVDANGRGGNILKIQNDGNLVIYRQDNSIVWALKMNNGQYDQNGGKGLLK
ncbi:MAG: hypothetical protein WAU01_13570 [Saprospiraceae bacterium]